MGYRYLSEFLFLVCCQQTFNLVTLLLNLILFRSCSILFFIGLVTSNIRDENWTSLKVWFYFLLPHNFTVINTNLYSVTHKCNGSNWACAPWWNSFFNMTLRSPQRGSSLIIIVQIFNLKLKYRFPICFVCFVLKLNVIQVFSTEGKL